MFRIERHRIPKVVAQRRKWIKFGDAAGEPVGPNKANTLVADDVFLTLTSNREVTGRDKSCVWWGREGGREGIYFTYFG